MTSSHFESNIIPHVHKVTDNVLSFLYCGRYVNVYSPVFSLIWPNYKVKIITCLWPVEIRHEFIHQVYSAENHVPNSFFSPNWFQLEKRICEMSQTLNRSGWTKSYRITDKSKNYSINPMDYNTK